MQNRLHTSCDFCAEILEGKSGTAEMRKEYISVRGSLMLKTYDEDTHHPFYTYAADKQNAMTPMHFCAKKSCLVDFLEARKFQREDYLRTKRDSDADFAPEY